MNGSLVPDQSLIDFFALMDREGLLERPFKTKTGLQLADHAYARQQAALEAKRARLESLRVEIAELEAELSHVDAR